MKTQPRLIAVMIGAALLACSACDRFIPQTSPSTPPESGSPASEPAAGATVYNGMTMDELKSVLANKGAAVTEIQPGFLRIENGPILLLTQCEQETCYEISIGRSFSNVRPTADAVNKWNYTRKIPEASIDDQGFLHMEFWVTTVGLTEQLLFDSIGWFEGALSEGAEYWEPYMTSPGS